MHYENSIENARGRWFSVNSETFTAGNCPTCGQTLDIINALSTAYGVHVPLFVDNAESVTRLEESDSQIIRLVVSENDKELRVNYEN